MSRGWHSQELAPSKSPPVQRTAEVAVAGDTIHYYYIIIIIIIIMVKNICVNSHFLLCYK